MYIKDVEVTVVSARTGKRVNDITLKITSRTFPLPAMKGSTSLS
jgi:hypothetical protein